MPCMFIRLEKIAEYGRSGQNQFINVPADNTYIRLYP